MLQELQLSVQAPISDWCMEKKKKKLELLQVQIPAVRKEPSQDPSTTQGAVHYSLPQCCLAKAERLGKN